MRHDILNSKFAASPKPAKLAILSTVLFCCWLFIPAFSADNPVQPLTEGSKLYIKVKLDGAIKTSKLKPGDVISGKLVLDVYSGTREIFPAGSEVHLTVDKLARRKRVPNDHWPWVIKFFTPRHENYPTFSSAMVVSPQGHSTNLQVSLITISPQIEVRAETKKSPSQPVNGTAAKNQPESAPQKKPARQAATIVALEAEIPEGSKESDQEGKSAGGQTPELPAGTFAKVVLLDPVSASKSGPGDLVSGRLIEPVRVGGAIVLPEGTLVKGKVVSRTPPRLLSRSGSLLLTFTQLQLPSEADIPIAASVSAAELNQRSHTKIDPEGKLRGDRPGKAWMLINIGTTAGIAKVSDDGTQLVIEAIVSTATDASTAGTARIVATCASGLFLLTRHGRDVVLPKFTEMNIVFDRNVELAPPQPPKTVP